jgi:DNA-binding beta-propeller fold protein YncE
VILGRVRGLLAVLLLPRASVAAAQPVAEWQVIGGVDLEAPMGVAVDATGDVYVADTGHHRIVKSAPQGPLLATFGGLEGDGAGQFSKPQGVAIGADGSIFVADTGNNRVQKLAQSGEVLAVWGGRRLWKDMKVPDGKILMPGVISHATDLVEHPDLTEDRILKYPSVVGKETSQPAPTAASARGVGH